MITETGEHVYSVHTGGNPRYKSQTEPPKKSMTNCSVHVTETLLYLENDIEKSH